MKPIVGINLDIDSGPPARARVNSSYYESIVAAGGVPVLLPPIPMQDLAYLIKRIDGLLLIGGDDYSPALYGEKISEKVQLINPVRQEFDLLLAKLVLSEHKRPVLGICGGLQLLNIALGGSLIQDIPEANPQSTVCHSKSCTQEPGDYQKHKVNFDRQSLLGSVYGVDTLEVNSFHHQAIKSLGTGLKVAARADDEIIEAVELPGKVFTAAVQWHPERDYENNRRLFDRFLNECLLNSQSAGNVTGIAR